MTTDLYVLPDSSGASIRNAVEVRSRADVRKAYTSPRHALWLACRASGLRVLPKALHLGRPRHALLAMESISESRRVLMDALFSVVVEPSHGTAILPLEELREVLASDSRDDLFVAAQVVPEDEVLVLFRGNLRSLIVPLSTFRRTKRGPAPDASCVSVTDYGQTVRLGEYEIAADALLYEFDPDARRRLKKRALRDDPSLGAAIRRLRLQRGISRDDFAPTSAKTLARIERGETQPRAGTLAKIAKRLGVSAEALATH